MSSEYEMIGFTCVGKESVAETLDLTSDIWISSLEVNL